MKKNKIKIDYQKCKSGAQIDPRDCRKCLFVCDPAVFLMHPTLDKHPNPFDPDKWMVTPVWPSICTGCFRCVKVCPVNAITVKPAAP